MAKVFSNTTPSGRVMEMHEVAIVIERERIERAGGHIHIAGDDTFTITFPAQEVDIAGLVNAFEDNGFTTEEAYSAIDGAVGKRNWRRLGQMVGMVD